MNINTINSMNSVTKKIKIVTNIYEQITILTPPPSPNISQIKLCARPSIMIVYMYVTIICKYCFTKFVAHLLFINYFTYRIGQWTVEIHP